MAGEQLYSANAKGEWRGADARARAASKARWRVPMSAATLKQLGYAAVIEAKTGRVDFDLNWAGRAVDRGVERCRGSRPGGAWTKAKLLA